MKTGKDTDCNILLEQLLDYSMSTWMNSLNRVTVDMKMSRLMFESKRMKEEMTLGSDQ
jgi:hypothetical protein